MYCTAECHILGSQIRPNSIQSILHFSSSFYLLKYLQKIACITTLTLARICYTLSFLTAHTPFSYVFFYIMFFIYCRYIRTNNIVWGFTRTWDFGPLNKSKGNAKKIMKRNVKQMGIMYLQSETQSLSKAKNQERSKTLVIHFVRVHYNTRGIIANL